MGRASYAILQRGDQWVVLHDGETNGDYATKEAAFESAIAAASLAIRQGHEVSVTAPGREAGNGTTTGAKDNPKKSKKNAYSNQAWL